MPYISFDQNLNGYFSGKESRDEWSRQFVSKTWFQALEAHPFIGYLHDYFEEEREDYDFNLPEDNMHVLYDGFYPFPEETNETPTNIYSDIYAKAVISNFFEKEAKKEYGYLPVSPEATCSFNDSIYE